MLLNHTKWRIHESIGRIWQSRVNGHKENKNHKKIEQKSNLRKNDKTTEWDKNGKLGYKKKKEIQLEN